MKNIKSKLLSAGIGTLATMPLIASCLPTTAIKALNNSSDELCVPSNGDGENQSEACTISYIGKKCSANGQAIIARATDCSPKAVHLKLKHFKRDELANKTIVGKLGLKYKMPEHTYAYTSCPLSEKTSDNPVWATGMWENNGINEMGVGTTSTLTCATNKKIIELPNEKWIKEGVGEELLTTIMTPQAATAKEAMQVAAKAIDEFGAQDANIIMATDQNESWLMEIYSAHQYCAVKMPDDKVMIAGNEFILDSLDALGINAKNKDDMCITSPGLLDVVESAGLAKYKGDVHDIFHLDLFNTYSLDGSNGNNKFRDTCHMRTWRGYSLWDQSSSSPKYSQTTKYEPFLTPKDEDGNTRNDMTAHDIFEVYRDQFDDIVDPTSPKYDPLFKQQKDAGTLRTIAVEQTRQVHIMSSDSTKPKYIACNEWYTPDSGNYVPFLQFNNAITQFDGGFGYYPSRFDFDESCSSVLFRELNKLAWYDRSNYGYPLQDFWRVFESIYCKQMQQVTDEASKLSESDAENILNNFNKHVRDIYMDQVKKTTDDLMWHICDEPHSKVAQKKFVPLIDLEQYVTELGWKNYHFDGNKATFERNDIKCTYTPSDGAIYGEGNLLLSNDRTINLRDSVVDNKVYVDMTNLNKLIVDYSELRQINIYDYLQKFNHLVWIIPVACAAVIGAGVGIFFLVKNKKQHNKRAKK